MRTESTYHNFRSYPTRSGHGSKLTELETGIFRRTIHPEVRVIDSNAGMVEYVASDETIDSYNEVIRADGWRFDRFKKNAPFVDTHDYSSIEKQVGQVVDFKVKGRRLVETVQWAKDVPENRLAQIGWKMTEAGFLKAVSVGFMPVQSVGPNDSEYRHQLADLGLERDAKVRRIFTEQQQIELSAVIIPANPNAVAKAYKEEILTDSDLSAFFPSFTYRANRPTVRDAFDETFLRQFERAVRHI